MRVFALLASLAMACSSCSGNGNNSPSADEQLGSGGGNADRSYKQKAAKPFVKRAKRTTGRHATATFAAGCYWCVEAIFEHVKGVDDAVSGFSGGAEQNPSYQDVALGKTGHTEAIQVHYDPDAVTYETLVRVLIGSMDPTQVDGQGPDLGRQYRSAIFFHDDEQREVATRVLAKARTEYTKPLAIELAKLEKFWPASDYHQDYEARNPGDGYIRAVSKPRLEAFKKKFPELLRSH